MQLHQQWKTANRKISRNPSPSRIRRSRHLTRSHQTRADAQQSPQAYRRSSPHSHPHPAEPPPQPESNFPSPPPNSSFTTMTASSKRTSRLNRRSRSPQHHHDRRTLRLTSHSHRPLQQILSTQPDQLLRLTQPRRSPRRQNNRSNPHCPTSKAHCTCRYRETPPSLTCRATSSADNRREAPSFPIQQACTSAITASAIASGPSPPRSSPTGA